MFLQTIVTSSFQNSGPETASCTWTKSTPLQLSSSPSSMVNTNTQTPTLLTSNTHSLPNTLCSDFSNVNVIKPLKPVYISCHKQPQHLKCISHLLYSNAHEVQHILYSVYFSLCNSCNPLTRLSGMHSPPSAKCPTSSASSLSVPFPSCSNGSLPHPKRLLPHNHLK